MSFKYYPAWFEDAKKIIENPKFQESVEAARYWLQHRKPISQSPERKLRDRENRSN